jgi:N-acyl homoserine lactone hydrolase
MRLAVLDFGSLELALTALIPGEGGGRWLTIGVPGYLIQTDDGMTILVDSGLPHEYHADPVAAARADGYDGWLRAVSANAENMPAGQLAKLGLRAVDVTHMVVTHTHFDHAGGLADFPDATLVVQRAERERPPLYKGFAWPEGARYQVVEGDVELAPGVRLLHTPGHTPGHCSLLLELPRTGPVLLAIDALYLPAVLERDNFKASWNEEQARASGRRVAALAEERSAWLVYGHDPEQWATLRKAPAWYE